MKPNSNGGGMKQGGESKHHLTAQFWQFDITTSKPISKYKIVADTKGSDYTEPRYANDTSILRWSMVI